MTKSDSDDARRILADCKSYRLTTEMIVALSAIFKRRYGASNDTGRKARRESAAGQVASGPATPDMMVQGRGARTAVPPCRLPSGGFRRAAAIDTDCTVRVASHIGGFPPRTEPPRAGSSRAPPSTTLLLVQGYAPLRDITASLATRLFSRPRNSPSFPSQKPRQAPFKTEATVSPPPSCVPSAPE